MLEIKDLVVSYKVNPVIEIERMQAAPAEVTAVVGSNGAGKTTLLRAISGMLKPLSGEIRFMGETITGCSTSEIVQRGIAHVPEGRQLFPRMTVLENMLMGSYLRTDSAKIASDIERVFDYFPILKEKAKLQARSLSGGQQQMLAFARAFMARPRMMMLDEPSVGLAPAVEHQLIMTIKRIAEEEGMGVILVEQNANLALSVSTLGFVLDLGKVRMAAPAAELANNPEVKQVYLGL